MRHTAAETEMRGSSLQRSLGFWVIGQKALTEHKDDWNHVTVRSAEQIHQGDVNEVTHLKNTMIPLRESGVFGDTA